MQTPPKPFSPFQFGIRHMLMLMLGVAAMSAGVAPWIRQWDWLQKSLLAVHVASLCGGLLGGVAIHWRKQLSAAPIYWSLPYITPLFVPGIYVLGLVLGAEIAVGQLIDLRQPVIGFLCAIIVGACVGLLLGGGVIREFLHPRLWVGEHGLFFQNRFVPWTKVAVAFSQQNVLLHVLNLDGRTFTTLTLSPKTGEDTQEFLRGHANPQIQSENIF